MDDANGTIYLVQRTVSGGAGGVEDVELLHGLGYYTTRAAAAAACRALEEGYHARRAANPYTAALDAQARKYRLRTYHPTWRVLAVALAP